MPDTWCGRPARGGEGGGRGAATRRSRAAARWTRARGRLTTGPTDGDRQTPRCRAAGRPEACESDFRGFSKEDSFFLFFLSFFFNFKAFSGFFYFFLQATRPESRGGCGDPRSGERGGRGSHRSIYTPPAPGAAGRRAPRDLGAVVPAHSALGPGRGGHTGVGAAARRHSDPGARRTAPLGPRPDPSAAFPTGCSVNHPLICY